MIELPEAFALSGQVTEYLSGKQVRGVTVLQTPHKFAWFSGDPEEYPNRLSGRTITGAEPHGGMVQVRLGDTSLVFQDGPSLRYHTDPASIPAKHQLLLEFADSTCLSVGIRMYGGILCFDGDDWDNPYYTVALERPSPLEAGFSQAYFQTVCDFPGFEKLSAKALLATEQRIPGLGNGVLQDILFNARIHPKRKMGTVSAEKLDVLYSSIRMTLAEMAQEGGRDTERDLLGEPGGYRTILSQRTVGSPCPRCAASIEKASYLGGSIYFCAACQPAP